MTPDELDAYRRREAERDEARQFARRFRHMAFEGFDNGRSVFQQLGLDKLPDWFDAVPADAEESK